MVRAFSALVILAVLAPAGAPALAAEDMLIADFEGRDYGDWTVEGEAFGPGPAAGTLGRQQAVSGFSGKGLVNTYYRGDATQGALTSPEFTIRRKYINFLIGGGKHPGRACVNLLVGGKIVRTATGANNERLVPASWNVTALTGKVARIRIVDRHTGGWGHINVDRIVQSDVARGARAGNVVAAGEEVATASSVQGGYRPEFAVDGDAKTRWASAKVVAGKSEWLRIDLGAVTAIDGLIIRWEKAYAAVYEVQVSNDGKRWRTLRRVSRGNGGIDVLPGVVGQGRFLRVVCLKGGPQKLFSIWEIGFTDEATGRSLAEGARKARAAADRRARQAAAEWTAGARRRLIALGVREIIFALRKVDPDGHWYANFSYWSNNPKRTLYHDGGRLCRLDVASGEVTTLLDDPTGGVRDPQVHYDGKKILFSYRKGGQPFYHLHEINVDGTGLRRLTDGPYDDIEPAYLPDGGIVFCSSRCNRMVQCYYVRVASIYRCDADGGNIRQLSSNIEQDNTPWVLPDGRILHQRWEYIDRSQVRFHHLWTMNPDGTNQMVYFGNMHGSVVFIDAKPIPGTGRILMSSSPGHGKREHAGHVTVVDPSRGPDHLGSARRISKALWRDPYPVTADYFLVAGDTAIHAMDATGRHGALYEMAQADKAAGLKMHEPRPVRPRPRERVIASRVDLSRSTGHAFLEDVYAGRNMAGVKRGEIKKLLVLEALPKPVNFNGAQVPLSIGGTFTLERILGTVPVEPDGSAFFEVPPLRSVFFVALDERNLSVKRMQSFMTVQPGETVGCVGCHEQRLMSPTSGGRRMATGRAPSRIEPIRDVPDVIDFPRDVQPILDRHCLPCHGYEKTDKGGPLAGGVILSGDRGPQYTGAAYPGTYASLGSGMVNVNTGAIRKITQKRCGKCHKGFRSRSLHNLTRPAKSLLLLKPLAPEAGGYGMYKKTTVDGKDVTKCETVFADTRDPDYQALLAVIRQATQQLNAIKRFDMPGFRPNIHYIREMKLYGVLPKDLKDSDPIDPYKVDQAYWRSLWHRPKPR